MGDPHVSTSLRILGLMSGTSVDGIDAALCELEPDPGLPGVLTMRLIGHREYPHPLRQKVLTLVDTQQTALAALAELNVLLGEAFAEAALSLMQELEAPAPDLISSHGQTVFHLVVGERTGATLQLGEPAIIAERTGVTVAADFRVADVAAGGSGAPLISLFDALYFGHSSRVRAIQNIGGMANVTFVPPGGPELCYAFDTGPGNVLIDYAARHFSHGREMCDRDGRLAARGHPNRELMEEVLSHEFFSQPPPRTTGRELYGDSLAAELIARATQRGLSREDIVATFTAITAESIARAYTAFGPTKIDDVILGGGGARNPVLVAELRGRLPGSNLQTHEDFGLPSDAKEALGFALLGHEAVHGRPGNLPGCTGASRPAVLGKIVPGRNYTELLRRVTGRRKEWEAIRSLRLAT